MECLFSTVIKCYCMQNWKTWCGWINHMICCNMLTVDIHCSMSINKRVDNGYWVMLISHFKKKKKNRFCWLNMTKPEKRRMFSVNHRHFVWLVAMVTVVTLFCIYISQHEVRLLNPLGNMFSLIVKNTATSGSLASLQLFYDDIKCIKEQSNKTCSFPLLTQFHQRCGYFAELTSWKNISKGFPAAAMSAHMCKLPLVTSAPRQLREYITKKETSLVLQSLVISRECDIQPRCSMYLRKLHLSAN